MAGAVKRRCLEQELEAWYEEAVNDSSKKAMRAGSSREDALAPVQQSPKVGEERKEAVKSNDKIINGIFLEPNNFLKYWVDKETGHNCFMMFPRGLSIAWSNNESYWHWLPLRKKSEKDDVAILLGVCWLDIHGKLEISYLTPGIMYEVVFIVMMNEAAAGWGIPVDLRLRLPDGSVRGHMESLEEKPRGTWIELKVGELRTQAGQEGKMDVSLWGNEGEHWKIGLTVRGIVIRPKKL
ncbi:lectin-like [Typha latifolia]|uniref:lectin-like n=1 Tax=Typha latifolia TaxID=4733 RepID=UPI003C2ADF8F